MDILELELERVRKNKEVNAVALDFQLRSENVTEVFLIMATSAGEYPIEFTSR